MSKAKFSAQAEPEKPGGFCQITNFFFCLNSNSPVSAK